jgi:predicted ATP-grasp superfamily ATP-dependent carboligase
MDKSIGAIITGGDFQGLAVLRTLAAKGIPVVLIDHEFCIGRTSRYKKKFFKAPNPANENEYIDFLINLVKMEKLFDWIIYPNSDQIVHVLSKNKNKLNEFINVPVPNYNVIDKVYNKKNTK